MRKLYRFNEAAEKFYDGDEETLRQSLLLGVVRARVELCDRGQWAWWADGDDEKGNPAAGRSEAASWRPMGPAGSYQLEGWFYLDRSRAARIAHGRMLSDLLVSESEEEERFLGLTFLVRKLVDLNDLFFEASENPDRIRNSEDEVLDEMGDKISTLTNDLGLIARFQAAANAGSEGFDMDSLQALMGEYNAIGQIALAKAVMAAAREEQRQKHAKGGKNKAANSTPNPEIAKAIEYARSHPGLSALQIKNRANLRASERTIRGWLSAGY